MSLAPLPVSAEPGAAALAALARDGLALFDPGKGTALDLLRGASALVGARQIRSRASCSSANTDVAPMKRNASPKTVASPVSGDLDTLSSSPCTANAPGAPSIPCNWSKISPRAASSPKTSPATEITINRRGAIENIV